MVLFLKLVNSFHATGFGGIESICFSDVFRGDRNRSVA